MKGRGRPAGHRESRRLDRREFLARTGTMVAAISMSSPAKISADRATRPLTTLFLCGDVMTGRGIDQVLRRPGDPTLHEPYVKSAARYVELAERLNGPIPRAVDPAYVWGDALAELDRRKPDARIVNLETAVTRGGEPWPGKAIHYRMEPANATCLTAARIDCCVLANNHVLDWSYDGLAETLATLRRLGLKTAGAGAGLGEAATPAIVEPRETVRVIVFALGSPTGGVPGEWEATADRPGVNLLPDLSEESARRIAAAVEAEVGDPRRAGDIVVASIHWGGNWGYPIPASRRRFAQRLIDTARVDIVHGHSSHHPLGIEVHRGHAILYGCGDFLNDYEGIGGYEEFRSELALAYHLGLDPATGRLERLVMTPFRRRRFRLEHASREEAAWLQRTLDREGRKLGTRVVAGEDGTLELRWDTGGGKRAVV